jgi:hypothetical protein
MRSIGCSAAMMSALSPFFNALPLSFPPLHAACRLAFTHTLLLWPVSCAHTEDRPLPISRSASSHFRSVARTKTRTLSYTEPRHAKLQLLRFRGAGKDSTNTWSSCCSECWTLKSSTRHDEITRVSHCVLQHIHLVISVAPAAIYGGLPSRTEPRCAESSHGG